METISKSDLFDIVEVLFDNFIKDHPDQTIIENSNIKMSVKYIAEITKSRKGKKNG